MGGWMGNDKIMFNHGTPNYKGVCILFKNNANYDIHSVHKDSEGRVIILDITIYETRLALCNLYAPNEVQSNFFANIIDNIESIFNDHRITGGDCNLVLNVNMDKKR